MCLKPIDMFRLRRSRRVRSHRPQGSQRGACPGCATPRDRGADGNCRCAGASTKLGCESNRHDGGALHVLITPHRRLRRDRGAHSGRSGEDGRAVAVRSRAWSRRSVAAQPLLSELRFFRGRPPLRPLARELWRFARELAWPPRLAKMAATDRDGSIAGRIAVSSPCTLI